MTHPEPGPWRCAQQGQGAWGCSPESANSCFRYNGDQLVDQLEIMEDGSIRSAFTGFKYIFHSN